MTEEYIEKYIRVHVYRPSISCLNLLERGMFIKYLNIHRSKENKTQQMFVTFFNPIEKNSFLCYVYVFIDP